MGKLRVVQNPPEDAGKKYGIGRNSFSEFIRKYTFDGSERDTDDELPLAIGDISATQDGREIYGGVMIRYLADRAIMQADTLESGTILLQARLAEGALKQLLQKRRAQEPEEGEVRTAHQQAEKERQARTDFTVQARELRTKSLARRAAEPLIDAAFTAVAEFEDDLGTLADDAVLALGSFEKPNELAESLPRLTTWDSSSGPTGVPA